MSPAYDSFYAPPLQINNNNITLDYKEAHHIIHVLRKKPGDFITIIDGLGNSYSCAITNIEKNTIFTKIVDQTKNNNEPATNLTLTIALPKKDKFEFIIEKCTELGVRTFIPLISARTQVKEKSLNYERLEKIAISAMKQSQRCFLPEITEPTRLAQLLLKTDYDLKIVAHEKIVETTLSKTIAKIKRPHKIILAIGPEGGFSEEEIFTLNQNGYIPVSLGKRRLRTETAAIVASAIIFDNLEQIS